MTPTCRHLRGPAAIAAIVLAAACAPSAAPPASAPAPTTPAAPAIMQTCPSSTDGPSIVVGAVEDAHRALAANPSTPLPPACVLTAFSQIARPLPDSINEHALAIATALRTRGTGDRRELLAAEIVLLARARRYAEVSQRYSQLIAVDSQPSVELSRLAMGAARQRGDTALLIRALTKASAQPGASAAYRSELSVVRQTAALWSAINEARGLLRSNPRYVAAYPSLVGNFGTLGLSDSVVSSLHRALAANAPRNTLATALETFVTTTLRHASLYGSTMGWDTFIAGAMRVDSVLSTPSTKFAVAAVTVQWAEPRIAEMTSLVSGTSLLPQAMGGAEQRSANRAAGCQRVPALAASLAIAEARLRDGGDKYAGGGVPQLAAALASAKERLSDLQDVCARSPA